MVSVAIVVLVPTASAETVVATITVGSVPFGVGVNDVTNKVYVANFGPAGSGHTVSVVDGSTNTVEATVGVGSGPRRIGVNEITNRIYVANSGSNNVSVIDGTTNTVVATVPVGTSPRHVGVNEITNMAYVANAGSNTVSVIDGSTNTVVATVPVGSDPRGAGVNAATNRVYVPNFAGGSGNTVSVIDGSTNTVVATIVVGTGFLGSLDAGVNAETNTVYVTNFGPAPGTGNTVSVIDGSTSTVEPNAIRVGNGPASAVVDDEANIVYVANSGSNNVSVIDGSTDTVVASVGVGISPRGLGVNKITKIAYVANSGLSSPPVPSNTVSVIEYEPSTVVSITSPADGATLFTDFGLALSATPGSGKIADGGTTVPRALLSPQGSLVTFVQVTYSNTGSVADGTLTLSDGGTVVGMLSLTAFRGAASTSFGVTLGLGAHTLAATLSLSNLAGSSTESASVAISVSGALSSLASLAFAVSGPAAPTYLGKLTFQVVSGGIVTAEGLLGDSASSFTSLDLPVSVSSDQNLLLQEPIRITVTGLGTITVTISITANGYSHSASITFNGSG